MQVNLNNANVVSQNQTNNAVSWKGWCLKPVSVVSSVLKRVISILTSFINLILNNKPSQPQIQHHSIAQSSSHSTKKNPTSRINTPLIDKTTAEANWDAVEEQIRVLLAHYGMVSDKAKQPIDVTNIEDLPTGGALRMQFQESEDRGEDRKIRKIFYELSEQQSAQSDSDGFVAIFPNGVDVFLKNLFDKSSWPKSI